MPPSTTYLAAVLVLAGGASGCGAPAGRYGAGAAGAPPVVAVPAAEAAGPLAPEPSAEPRVVPASPCSSLESCASEAITQLKAGDLAALAQLVHPNKGVRFSPYAYVDPVADVVLTRAGLAKAAHDPLVRHWGAYDGSGEPIDLPFASYAAKFVYSRDFVSVAPTLDPPPRQSNTLDNAREIYPQARMVEYYLPGTEELAWASLKLVFDPSGSRLHLVGIIHSQWTI